MNEYDETSYDKYGFKSSIKNESGQTIVTFTNDSYDITSGIGIIAEYDNTGKMISVQTKELSLDFDESESITLNDSNVRYKAYVLDPKNGLQMLSPVVEYNRLNA